MKLYPLKFHPILKDKLWGGDQLNELKNIQSPIPKLGESWEVSAIPNDVSVVCEGPLKGTSLTDLITTYGEQLLGSKVTEVFGKKFPLLIKYINAAQDLSIQVHPDDRMALRRHNSFGKTEMWYIMDAEPEARLILGFKEQSDKDAFAKAIKENTVESLLNEEVVKPGNAYFIKPGLVHAIGAGITLAEIQQSSDITYRVYDFDRRDDNGNLRELHIDESLEASDYTQVKDHKIKYDPEAKKSQNLAKTQYFVTNYNHFNDCINLEVANKFSFKVLMNVGDTDVTLIYNGENYPFAKGQTYLIPACIPYVKLQADNGDAKVLSIHS